MPNNPHRPLARAPMPVTVIKNGERQKVVGDRWSHQDDLSLLKGQFIDVEFMNGKKPDRFELIDSDQFTIKVYGDKERKYITTYYKHAIAGYQVATPVPSTNI
jgi:hypothetical protein